MANKGAEFIEGAKDRVMDVVDIILDRVDVTLEYIDRHDGPIDKLKQFIIRSHNDDQERKQ